MSNLGALDMALDDVISQNRTNKRNTSNTGGRRGGSSRGGISKNRPSGSRSSPYNGASRPARNNTPLRTSRPASSNTRASNSLVVANLHFNVTEKDLYDLFGQIGKLKRAFLHIGPNGKSSGIADVVFVSSQDAERARNTYNNVELDGRPMRISTASIISAVSSAPSSNAGRRSGNLRGGNNSGRRGGSAKRESRSKPNQRDLDADMDSYMGNNEDVQMN